MPGKQIKRNKPHAQTIPYEKILTKTKKSKMSKNISKIDF
jgi:hypothetical protein